jgi:hypothetical protein
VETVGENHRAVKVRQLVDDDDFRSFCRFVLAEEMAGVTGTMDQAGIVGGGVFTRMTACTGSHAVGRRLVEVVQWMGWFDDLVHSQGGDRNQDQPKKRKSENK